MTLIQTYTMSMHARAMHMVAFVRAYYKASLTSDKTYVWRSGAKQAAGMKMVVTANRSTTPKN